MSDQNTTEGLVLGHQHMHAFAPEDFRKVYGAVTHAILRGDTRMTTIERVRDMVSRVWVPANLAIRDDKDVAGIGVRTLLAWSQELALIVAQMKADEQERERLRDAVEKTRRALYNNVECDCRETLTFDCWKCNLMRELN